MATDATLERGQLPQPSGADRHEGDDRGIGLTTLQGGQEALIRGEHQGDVAFGVAGMPDQIADELVHIGVGKHAVHQRDHGHAAGCGDQECPDGFVLDHWPPHPVARVKMGGQRPAGQGQDRAGTGLVLVEDIEHLLAVALLPAGRIAGDQGTG
jgi:hypothetical protein